MDGYATEERDLLEIIAMLHQDYTKAARPYIDRLVMLRSYRKPEPMIVTIDQARSMGFEVPLIIKGEQDGSVSVLRRAARR